MAKRKLNKSGKRGIRINKLTNYEESLKALMSKTDIKNADTKYMNNLPVFSFTDNDPKMIVPPVANKALVPMALPEIKITGHGILALRKWQFTDGWLKSESQNTIWKEQMVADEPPAKENKNGLYGTEFSPVGLMQHGSRYLVEYNTNIFVGAPRNILEEFVLGIIQMRGKIINTEDCILRAEWAKIVCLFVPGDEYANEIVPALIENYPNTAVYVLHCRQITETLFRALEKRRQQDDDQFSG